MVPAKADPFNAGDWTIWLSSTGYQPVGPLTCGVIGDLPVPADFDGDRLADPAVFNNGQWTFWLSSDEYRPFGPSIYGGPCRAITMATA